MQKYLLITIRAKYRAFDAWDLSINKRFEYWNLECESFHRFEKTPIWFQKECFTGMDYVHISRYV